MDRGSEEKGRKWEGKGRNRCRTQEKGKQKCKPYRKVGHNWNATLGPWRRNIQYGEWPKGAANRKYEGRENINAGSEQAKVSKGG